MTPSHSSGNGNRAAREPFSLRTNHPSTLHLSPRRRKFKHDAENLPPHPANAVHTNFSVKPSYDSSENAPSCSPFSNKNIKNRAVSTRPNPVDSVEALDGSREEFCASKRRLDWERQGERTTSELSSIPMQESAMDTGVKVFVRLRPLNHKESQDEATHVVEMTSGNSLCLADQNFTFDAVLGPEASQETVFQAVGLPLVENCLAGFNSSIFAYGQTGSGKTHTMWGAVNEPIAGQALSEDCGVTPRVFERLFKRMEEEEHNNANKGLHYQCQCSFLEIYNEQITDLLDMTQKSLQIREDLHTGVYVENLTVEPITGIDDVTQLLLRGLANRRIGATSMNAESSRSHSVFTCVIESRFRNLADGTKSTRTSRINLVDLAGSERQKLTGASGERLKEAGNINRSLSQLGNLISILAEMSQTGKQRHIPYRDSRLTFLLQESLGGNAKLVMICAISPASSCRNETLSTLRFAQRAKSITNKAVVNEETENDVKFLRDQVRQLKEELIRIKSDQSQCKGVASCSTDLKSAMRDRNLCATSLKQTLISAPLNFNENEEIDNAIPEFIDPGTLQTSDGAMIMFESSGFGCEGKDTFLCGHADTDRELATFESSGASALESGNFIADNDLVPTPKDERGRPAILLNHSVDSLLEEVVGETSALLLNHSADDSSCAKEQEDKEIELQGCKDTDFLKEIRASPSQNSHNCDMSTEKEEPSLSKLECDKFSNDVTSSKSLNHNLVNFDDNMSNVPLPHLKADLASHTSVNDLHILNTEDCTQIESECGVQTSAISNPFPHSSCLLLASPTLTESPPMKAYKQKDDMFLPVLPDASFGNWPTDLEKRMEPSSISSVQSSKIAFTNSVASTLQLGIQLHESQKNNLDIEDSSIQFSFQTADIKEWRPLDMAVERSPGWIETAANFSDPANSNDPIGPSSDKLQCQLLMSAESTMSVPVCDNTTQAFEKLQPILAAALRREGTLEEALKTAKEDIKQLDSLVCQYKNERQCNVFLHQIQESRISRLQNLIHGVIDKSLFMNEELETIATEKKLLQEIIDQHPEVAHANLERRRTCEKLDRYRHFFDLGERDILLKDVSELRDCVLPHMDVDSVKSVTQSSSSLIAKTEQSLLGARTETKTSLVLSSVSENAWLFHPEGDMLSEIKNLNEMWELERRQWTECEKNWMLTLEEWRVKAEMYRNLSEERKHMVECEQRRTEEMTEALQMAMKGHGYLLDQYAELQEKHLVLLAKHRRIREAIGDMKRKAGRAGIKETRWLEAQAAEIMVLKLQQERERKAAVVHLGELQAQLKDTSDAVHAAGELLVRLKETEEAVSIAQKSTAVVEQEAANLKDEMEQLKRKHEVEIRTLQQQLSESRIENRTVYPQYDSVQYVDSNHTANFGDEDKGGDVDLGDKQQLANELDAVHEFRSAFEPFPQDFDSCSSSL